MEAFYSPSTHTLALIPRSPSSFSSPCVCAPRIQSFQTEFFGKQPKLRLNSYYRKLSRSSSSGTSSTVSTGVNVPVASLSTLPVVAVVVAVTISAAALVFSNLHRFKRKRDFDEVPDPPPAGKDLHDGNTGEHLHPEAVQITPHNELDDGNTGEHLHTEAVKSTPHTDNGSVKLSYQDPSSTLEETPNVENVDIPNLHFDDIPSVPPQSPYFTLQPEASSPSEFIPVTVPEETPEAYKHSEDNEEITVSLHQASPNLSTPEPPTLLREESNLVNEETEIHITPSAHVLEMRDAVTEVLDIAITKDDDHEGPKPEHHETETNHDGGTVPSRVDIYSFYENTSVSNNTTLPHKAPELSTKLSSGNGSFLLTARNVATKPLQKEHSQETVQSVTHETGVWKRKGSLKSDTRDTSIHDDRLQDVPDKQVMQVNGKHTLSSHMASYNRLLKKGRLHECIELLEDLNSKDLLDMSKIYHTRFFNLCREQKAVKQAFSFAELIPDPTLSTFNMLMSVCSAARDSNGAFETMRLVQKAGLKADCKLYTTLISTCAKSGKVDKMFEVFHEMVNRGEEPNVNTYGALIDGCARAGQVAKAFGAYGILRSKNVKPDRVVFNALITACGQSGAVERAFDVLSEMGAELHPIDPDHVTIGALIKACTSAGQTDRIKEVYKMIDKYKIKGTPELYTIAVNSCSQTGDWEFACNVYADMKKKGVIPDEMFFSALIHVAGRSGNLEAAFEVLQDARTEGMTPGIVSYSSLMGACSNAQSWKRALELFEQIKAMNLNPTVSTVNALITALCDASQMKKAMNVFSEMKELRLRPNDVTYSILIAACERNDDIEAGLALFYQAKADAVPFSQFMCKCLIKMCSRRFEKVSTMGEPVLSFKSGRPQIESKWSSLALMIYRDIIGAGLIPSAEMLSQILGCLQLPQDVTLKQRLTENLKISVETSRKINLLPLVDGFAEYDIRAFSLFEEAASLGIVPCVSFKESPIVIDARDLNAHIAKVYILTVLKGLKHRLAAGAKLQSITILLSVHSTKISSPAGEKTINVAGRVSQTIGALLRRLKLQYQGDESLGKIRITGLAVKRWFQPKLIPSLRGKRSELGLFQFGLKKGISNQRRNIRSGNLSLD